MQCCWLERPNGDSHVYRWHPRNHSPHRSHHLRGAKSVGASRRAPCELSARDLPRGLCKAEQQRPSFIFPYAVAGSRPFRFPQSCLSLSRNRRQPSSITSITLCPISLLPTRCGACAAGETIDGRIARLGTPTLIRELDASNITTGGTAIAGCRFACLTGL